MKDNTRVCSRFSLIGMLFRDSFLLLLCIHITHSLLVTILHNKPWKAASASERLFRSLTSPLACSWSLLLILIASQSCLTRQEVKLLMILTLFKLGLLLAQVTFLPVFSPCGSSRGLSHIV